jgi:hypothetical protein
MGEVVPDILLELLDKIDLTDLTPPYGDLTSRFSVVFDLILPCL